MMSTLALRLRHAVQILYLRHGVLAYMMAADILVPSHHCGHSGRRAAASPGRRAAAASAASAPAENGSGGIGPGGWWTSGSGRRGRRRGPICSQRRRGRRGRIGLRWGSVPPSLQLSFSLSVPLLCPPPADYLTGMLSVRLG